MYYGALACVANSENRRYRLQDPQVTGPLLFQTSVKMTHVKIICLKTGKENYSKRTMSALPSLFCFLVSSLHVVRIGCDHCQQLHCISNTDCWLSDLCCLGRSDTSFYSVVRVCFFLVDFVTPFPFNDKVLPLERWTSHVWCDKLLRRAALHWWDHSWVHGGSIKYVYHSTMGHLCLWHLQV